MNRSKAKGTAWETEIVRYLKGEGWSQVERRTLSGANDRGDIAGIPGVVIEAKNEKKVSLAGWVDEASTEGLNANADVAVVWAHRMRRVWPGHGYVVMTGEQFVRLLKMAGY